MLKPPRRHRFRHFRCRRRRFLLPTHYFAITPPLLPPILLIRHDSAAPVTPDFAAALRRRITPPPPPPFSSQFFTPIAHIFIIAEATSLITPLIAAWFSFSYFHYEAPPPALLSPRH